MYDIHTYILHIYDNDNVNNKVTLPCHWFGVTSTPVHFYEHF